MPAPELRRAVECRNNARRRLGNIRCEARAADRVIGGKNVALSEQGDDAPGAVVEMNVNDQIADAARRAFIEVWHDGVDVGAWTQPETDAANPVLADLNAFLAQFSWLRQEVRGRRTMPTTRSWD